MKIIAALLLLSAPASEPSGAETDAQDIVRAVLAREAYVHGADREPVCVAAAVDGITAEGWRRDPHSKVQGLSWERLGRLEGESLRSGRGLASSEAQPINEALGLVLRGPPAPYVVRNVDPSWLPRPFSFCKTAQQSRRLEIASPAIAGDMAFVAVDYFCPACGEGRIFALRRSASGWAVIAETFIWAS
ncbi:MAG TPA: hypothetical protein VH331_17315 [Allosphingosinicella sp.]|jgi:hypothetical protein|nr:hypothetical protein [Allosphingosinicella sp.]